MIKQRDECFKCGHAWHPDECVNTAPPARKPLTDEEIKDCEKQSMVNGSLPFEQRLLFARAIERAHGIGEP